MEPLMVDWKGLKALGFPYSRAELQRMEDENRFPRRLRLNPDKGKRSRVAWRYRPVVEWFESRIEAPAKPPEDHGS